MWNRSLATDIGFCLLALLAALMIASTSALHPDRSGYARGSDRDPKEDVANADREVEKLLTGKKAEAREWLNEKNEKHVVWKWSNAAALKSMNEAIAAGAKEVWAVDFSDTPGGGQMTATFVIVLPTDAGPRKKVFEWIRRWEKEIELDKEDHTKDLGQRYFVLSTDQ